MYQWELIVQATVTKIWRSGQQKRKLSHTIQIRGYNDHSPNSTSTREGSDHITVRSSTTYPTKLCVVIVQLVKYLTHKTNQLIGKSWG